MKVTRSLGRVAALAGSLAYLGAVHVAGAVNIPSDLNGISKQNNVVDVAIVILNWVLGATGLAAVAFLIVGGFRYIASAGNEDLAEDAKATMTNAVIGLVVVLLAFVIANTINQLLLNGR